MTDAERVDVLLDEVVRLRRDNAAMRAVLARTCNAVCACIESNPAHGMTPAERAATWRIFLQQ